MKINCDLGEWQSDEAQWMPWIDWANVACGGHAGDLDSIRKTVRLAKDNGLSIGAHPSYPDREHFGRVTLSISESELIETLIEQLSCIQTICNEESVALHHIKAHGALYHEVMRDLATATALLEATLQVTDCRKWVVSASAPMLNHFSEWAEANGIHLFKEAFADRLYTAEGLLVSRFEADAMLEDSIHIENQLQQLIKSSQVRTNEGRWLSIDAQTICVHGDHSPSLEALKSYRTSLGREPS